jgi:agmatinase
MIPSNFDPNAAATQSGIFGLPPTADHCRVVLIPMPFDATTSYRAGAAGAPEAILQASWQVDLHDVETGEPWQQGIFMSDPFDDISALNAEASGLAQPIKDSGGASSTSPQLARINQIGELLCERLRAECARWIDQGRWVGVVGGDHSCALGSILAHADRYPGMGVLQIDAHADLRSAYEGFVHSHASVMHNVLQRSTAVAKLVQVGVRDLCQAERAAIDRSDGRISCWFDAAICRALFEGQSFATVVARIVEQLPAEVYVSFDIDGLDPSMCANTGTPVPGGLSFQQASFLLGAVVASGRRIVGFDLCEVVAGPGPESIDAMVGARLLYKLIGWGCRTRG